MKKIIFTFLIIHCSLIIAIAQSGWVQQNSGTSNPLFWTSFIDENTGFVVGLNGTLLRTSNGGSTWQQINTNTLHSLIKIYFKNSQTGFVIGDSLDHYILLRSTDNGITWALQMNISASIRPETIIFKNELTGFIAGVGIRYKTVDGGNTWTELPEPFYYTHLYSSFKVNENKIFWVGTRSNPPDPASRAIYYTTDGGINFNMMLMGAGTLNDIAFADNDIGFIVGTGYLARTSDGGFNWTTINAPYNFGSSVCFSSSSNVFRTVNSDIYFSSNTGLNWIVQHHVTSNSIYCIRFVNVNTGYCVGSSGLILKTTNGGTIGINQINSQVPFEFKLLQNYPNPFNPSTKIKFEIPLLNPPLGKGGRGLSSGGVSLKVYDIIGKEVAVLVNEQLQPGTYEVEWNASAFSSGIYFYQLSTNNFVQTKKLILLK